MATPAHPPRLVRFGAYEADLRTGELRKQGLRVRLQDQPFQVLVMLVERPGELITREEIRQRLWPAETFVDFDHGVNTAIRRLRDALCDSADHPRYVETLPRHGYRFLGEVELIGDGDFPMHASASPKVSTVHEASVTAPDSQTDEPPVSNSENRERRRRSRWIAVGAAALALLLVSGVVALRAFRTARPFETASARHAAPPGASTRFDSIAVLPFRNETGDPDLDYIGNGLSESLIDSLTEIPGLRVVSRNSAFQMRNSQLTTSEIGRRLNTRAVLIGSIRRTNEGLLRMSVELVDAKTDDHVWGQEYPFSVYQAGPIQPMLARELYDIMRLKLDRGAEERIAKQLTTNASAYDAYLRGRFAFRLRNPASVRQAITHFQHAIDRDPDFGLAYAGLADALTVSTYYNAVPPRPSLSMADAAVKRALQLAPNHPNVRLTWAYQLANGHRDLPAAIEEARRVVDAHPNLAEAHEALGGFLAYGGAPEEGLEHHRIGLELDPEWPVARSKYFFNLLQLRRYQDAREFAMNPLFQAIVAVYDQRYGDAVAIYDKDPKLTTPASVSVRAIAYARAGRRADAEAMLRKLLEKRRNGYASPSDIGWIYFALGDTDNTFKWFNTADEELDLAAGFLPENPLLDSLRSDPRWSEFVRRIRTPR